MTDFEQIKDIVFSAVRSNLTVQMEGKDACLEEQTA